MFYVIFDLVMAKLNIGPKWIFRLAERGMGLNMTTECSFKKKHVCHRQAIKVRCPTPQNINKCCGMYLNTSVHWLPLVTVEMIVQKWVFHICIFVTYHSYCCLYNYWLWSGRSCMHMYIYTYMLIWSEMFGFYQ